jgi:hypothetical protein
MTAAPAHGDRLASLFDSGMFATTAEQAAPPLFPGTLRIGYMDQQSYPRPESQHQSSPIAPAP